MAEAHAQEQLAQAVRRIQQLEAKVESERRDRETAALREAVREQRAEMERRLLLAEMRVAQKDTDMK